MGPSAPSAQGGRAEAVAQSSANRFTRRTLRDARLSAEQRDRLLQIEPLQAEAAWI